MDQEKLRKIWKQEEDIAYIHGWDFSHIEDRYEEGNDLPWDYRQIIKEQLHSEMRLLDHDTGGGEFLLSLNHPYERTAATEGYPPNVALCQDTLLPLGIDFRECADPGHLPYPDERFDIIINRHGDMNPGEYYRLLKKGGIFITQQVGEDNDRDLVKMVLPHVPKPFPGHNLHQQTKAFEDTGFRILREAEAFRPITFYDVGAFVWFARIIQWEFPGFSVDGCFEELLKLQEIIETDGKIEGTTHRFLLVAQKA